MSIQYPHELGAYLPVILVFLAICVGFTSNSLLLAKRYPRRNRELISWLATDFFALATLIAFSTPAFSKNDPQKNFLILGANVSAMILVALRVRTRLHFFRQEAPIAEQALVRQKEGIEIKFRLSDMQFQAIRKLVERISRSNALASERDTLQDTAHTIDALLVIQAALDHIDH